jgi:sterol desaturase/sphingolipid hydroxylase (fatty acid hydroxylase superfamily)
VGFVAINGHLFSLLFAPVNAWAALAATDLLRQAGLAPSGSALAGWPFAAQLAAYFLVSDFLQWCIHNLLHRVPFLWTFHKVHHSVTVMDFWGNWRFHWMEVVVYRSLQWLPLAWLGAPPAVVMVVAVVGTFWGDLNHSNLDVGLGRLGYVLNSPRMHLWHHDISDEGGIAKNYGIVLSLWDFLFGTAYWPRDRSPRALGYPGMEEMPQSLAGELLWPLARKRSRDLTAPVSGA